MFPFIRNLNKLSYFFRNFPFPPTDPLPLMNVASTGMKFPLPSGPLMNGSIIESLKNWTGITWATPKTRRSVERRWRRRFGDPKWAATGGCNILKPKKALITCDTCGNHHEHFTICGYCYAIVKKETEELQKKVRETLLLSPVREEIELVYANEKETMNEKEFMGKRIVEIDRERPAWFAKNLLSLTGSASPNQDKSLKIDANRGQLKIKD